MRTIFTIWTEPEKTFEYLDKNENNDLGEKLDILFYLGSLAIVIPIMANIFKSMGNHSIGYLIIGSIVTAFMGALIFKFVYAFGLWLVGKILHGKASRFQVQLVMAYTMIPGLINLFFSIVLIVIAIIMKDIDIIGYQNPLTLFIIWLFGIRTVIIGIAKFNKFSYAFALINIGIVTVLLQGIVFGIKYLIN